MKNNQDLRLSPIFFSGYSYSRSVPCCGCPAPYQKVVIYTTHNKKAIAKLYTFAFRSKIAEKQ